MSGSEFKFLGMTPAQVRSQLADRHAFLQYDNEMRAMRVEATTDMPDTRQAKRQAERKAQKLLARSAKRSAHRKAKAARKEKPRG